MDNFLATDIHQFIYDKSFEMFKILNKLELDVKKFILEKKRLSGISNTIFQVIIRRITDSEEDHENSNILIDSLFFKVFGRISVIVDRELETFIMEQLNPKGKAAKIYFTDLKTFRIEEFINGAQILERENMLNELVLEKMISNFSNLNVIGDFQYYFTYVGRSEKSEFFEKLKNDPKSNIVNFCLNKIRPVALKSFKTFKEKYINDGKPDFINAEKFNRVEYYLEKFETIFFDVFPNQGIFAINHNDGHPLNILYKGNNYDQVILTDYEYSSYNLIGFDIVNYLIETFFLLDAPEFPFYQYFSDDINSDLKQEKYFEIFLSYFDNFEKENGIYFAKLEDYKIIIENSKTKDYYYRLIGLSALIWFIFGILYYDYDSIKTKSGFDYFTFSYLRGANICHLLFKNENIIKY